MYVLRTAWLGVASALLAACGSGSTDAPAATAEASDSPPVRLEVRGTRDKALRDGFVRLMPNCQEWTETPTLGPMIIQIPETWDIVKGRSGPRDAHVALVAGNVQKTLRVRMLDQRFGSPPNPEYLGGPEAKAVGQVSWGERPSTVFASSYGYSVYLPTLSVEGMGDVYAFLTLNDPGRGDISELDQQKVLSIFETAQLDRCAVESYARIFRNAEIILLDDD
jgi:hypothetical protein